MFNSRCDCYSTWQMSSSFFFYDLETSGLNPRTSRVMQFAGIRTDMDLKQIGDPVNVLVKLSDDVLPDPGAIMVTGITPQQTLSDGLTEPEFCKLLSEQVFTSDTITVGFNSVRFDDEFIRYMFWRNFYDPYEWAWSEGRSRWDMLDVVRMTRALRPEGIKWPVDETGKAVNKLELIAVENALNHEKAHDALSDVEALIGIAKLIKQKQPKLFDYLLKLRDKKEVAKLVNLEDPQPFVYASGRYDAQFEKTTVAFPLAPGAKPGSVLVYDLRYDPSHFLKASPAALASVIFADRTTREAEGFERLPVKALSYNKCPAVAPLGVLDDTARERLSINLDDGKKHLGLLHANPAFAGAVREAFEMREPFEPSSDVEAQLYDGFVGDKDKGRMGAVRAANATELADFHPQFADDRLSELLFRYKARWFSNSLSEEEAKRWEAFRGEKLKSQLPLYMEQLKKMASYTRDTYLLEELQLWAESIVPAEL